LDVGAGKDIDILQSWLDPDFTCRAADFRELGFARGFDQVEDDGGSVGPFAEDSSRVISAKELITANAMTASACSTPKFANSSPTCESPKSSVSETDNEIRIMIENLFTKPIQLRLELATDVAGFDEGGVGLYTLTFSTAEPFEAVPGRMYIEHVRAKDLFVKPPNRVNRLWVPPPVIVRDVVSINSSEFDDSCFM
jgi:hypothetical protein